MYIIHSFVCIMKMIRFTVRFGLVWFGLHILRLDIGSLARSLARSVGRGGEREGGRGNIEVVLSSSGGMNRSGRLGWVGLVWLSTLR